MILMPSISREKIPLRKPVIFYFGFVIIRIYIEITERYLGVSIITAAKNLNELSKEGIKKTKTQDIDRPPT